MGEAKRRGTYEQRKAEAIDLKKRFDAVMRELKALRGKSIAPEVRSSPVSPDRVWYDDLDSSSKEISDGSE